MKYVCSFLISLLLLSTTVLTAQEKSAADPDEKTQEKEEKNTEKTEDPLEKARKEALETAKQLEKQKALEAKAKAKEAAAKQKNVKEEKKEDKELTKAVEKASNVIDKKYKKRRHKKKGSYHKKKKCSRHKKEHAAVTFKPYGYIEMYRWHNDADFLGNDLMLFVDSESRNNTGWTAKGTRIGVAIGFPSIREVELSGKLEVDFVANMNTSGFAEGHHNIRMRHALIDMRKSTKAVTLGMLAGQTWAPFTALIFPHITNPGAGWAMGNVWQRMPQLQLYAHYKLSKSMNLMFQVAAAAPMSGSSANKGNLLFTNVDTGFASRMPMFQGLISLKGALRALKLHVAIGGAIGKENYDKYDHEVPDMNGEEVDVYIANAALSLSHKYAGISGKYYIGKNADVFGAFTSSVVKDANGMVTDGLEVKGFWGEFSVTPRPQIRASIGYGKEDPKEIQKGFASEYDAGFKDNSAIWTTFYYTLYERYTLGFQYMNMKTVRVVTDEDENRSWATLKGNNFTVSFKLTF